jgi:hypothetical protein
MAAFSIKSLPEDYQNKICPEPFSGCWIWMGSLNLYGYGRKRRPTPNPTGKISAVHRDVFTMLKAPIPDGLELDHKCRVRSCCNPDHLEPVTHEVNQKRGERNQYSTKTHCPEGHLYSGDNLVLYYKEGKGPFRQCRICRKEAMKRWHRRRGNVKRDGMDITKRKRRFSIGKPLFRGNLAID